MKGIVFVELIRMAESVMGEEAVDDILEKAKLENDGAFTAVGNYPCRELLAIVDAIGAELGAPIEALHKQFGHWMFGRFVEGYPVFFEGKNDGFDMLESIEGEVHVEVRKLYPEVELPTFATERLEDGRFKMVYSSERPLQHFCHGLIEACLQHFEHDASIQMTEQKGGGKFCAEFLMQKAV
ncbi:heme NO-binding domain-containing protein [Shimia sagamensis]|uniref:Haem-NO-binding n=1 Tax=Shimia sagamensis TaxID=1566352 RepID=A0ABY1PFT4_9RHOB|nr:heme NO-binding domain-containing protein [Shimia sagamensis]SMP33454.1 Haem-NO-binding [Shimia sagamensis]